MIIPFSFRAADTFFGDVDAMIARNTKYIFAFLCPTMREIYEVKNCKDFLEILTFDRILDQ